MESLLQNDFGIVLAFCFILGASFLFSLAYLYDSELRERKSRESLQNKSSTLHFLGQLLGSADANTKESARISLSARISGQAATEELSNHVFEGGGTTGDQQRANL